MEIESVAKALEREHQEIDAGIAAFTAGYSAGNQDPDTLTRAIRALRRHIYLEEEFLFPLMCRAEPGLTAPVLVMLREHAQIWSLLELLEDAPDAGRAQCKRLTSQLLHHNLKEERVLYPRADDILPTAVADRLRAFLDTGDLPDGWVCTRARPVAPDAGR